MTPDTSRIPHSLDSTGSVERQSRWQRTASTPASQPGGDRVRGGTGHGGSTSLVARSLLVVGFASLLGGCVRVGPDYVALTPSELGVPSSWLGSAPAAGSERDVTSWWQHLGDKTLTRLIAQAL